MNTQIQKISVKGIVERQGRILMLKDDKGKWELPGGKIDFGEHPEAALRREFLEELGMSHLDILKPIHIWTFTVARDSVDYQFIIIVYECQMPSGDLCISDEHLEYQWIQSKDVVHYEMKDGYRESIERYFTRRK